MLRGVLVVEWKRKLVRCCVGSAMACLGPIAIAHNGGQEQETVAQTWPEGEAPVAMWRCGRQPLPHQVR